MKIQLKNLQENSGSYSLYSYSKPVLKNVSFQAAVEYAKCLPAIRGESALNVPCTICGNNRTFSATPVLAAGFFQVYLKAI